MKKPGKIGLFLSVLWVSSTCMAEMDYYQIVEAEALIATKYEAQQKPQGHYDVKQRLRQLREASPLAYLTYKKLPQQYKAEIIEALRSGKEIDQVREMIFARVQ